MPDEREDRAAADGDGEPQDDADERSTTGDEEPLDDPPAGEREDGPDATGPTAPDGGDPGDGEPTISGDGLSYDDGDDGREDDGDDGSETDEPDTRGATDEPDTRGAADEPDGGAGDEPDDAAAGDPDDDDPDAEGDDGREADAETDRAEDDSGAGDEGVEDETGDGNDGVDGETGPGDDRVEDETDGADVDADDADQSDADDDADESDADGGGIQATNLHKANAQSEVPRGKPERKKRTKGSAASGTAEAEASAETGTGTGEPTYPDDVGGISTPPDDEEMPLADHIEEMISRVAIVLLFGAAGTAIGILWASDAIAFIWADVIPEAEEWPPHIYHPLELWLTRIKVAALLGIMVALPMFVYQCYLFMRPGLYPHERKYYLAAVPTSVVLAGVGMLFSYLLVLPLLFEYFTFYSEGSAEIHYALGETFNLVITLTAFLAIVFQIPLLIMMAIMMGVTSRRWLAQKRLYFWAAFAGLAFMFTFDPTMMAPVIVAIVMIGLFEGTLGILKWVGVD